jgi:hypothetical protein
VSGKHAIAAAFLTCSASVGCINAQVKIAHLNDLISVEIDGKPFTSLFIDPELSKPYLYPLRAAPERLSPGVFPWRTAPETVKTIRSIVG